MAFTHLHRHSRFSILDGTGSGDQWAELAAEKGFTSLALTDHASLAGTLEHISGCDKYNIMPIVGVEVYIRENRLDHTPRVVVDDKGKKKSIAPQRWHLTLLAMNFTGWINLQRITSESYSSGLYFRPCVDFDLLARYNEGVYCLLGCVSGMFAGHLQAGGLHLPQYLSVMRSIFGDRMSAEIMPHSWDTQRQVNIDTINACNDASIPIAVTGDAHMLTPEWVSAQDTMLQLATGQSNLKREKKIAAGEKIYTMHQDDPTLWFMSEQEMAQAFASFQPHIPASVVQTGMDHTGEIVSKFTPFYLDRQIKMPHIGHEIIAKIDDRVPDPNIDSDELVKRTLKRWCLEGLEELKLTYPNEHWQKYPVERYEQQIQYELDVLEQVGMHAVRYMLMVAGEIRWARDNEIVVGPGRGSAAGSLVAYTSGITDIDPIPYKLKFGRFINPGRKGMPDIDVDFMPGVTGKDRVIQHTKEIYGEHNVIPIAAYGTYGPRKALGDTCRVFDDVIDFPTAQRYVKAIDLKPVEKDNLEECAARFPEIAEFKTRYPALWDVATKIEGHPFSQSSHASGVLVKPNDIEIPTAAKIDKGTGERAEVTAWPDTKELLANYGWLKIDYLVIEGLIRQHEVMNALALREGTPIDLQRLPVRWDPEAVDPAVMAQFCKAKTLGCWQMEGKATLPLLKSIQPSNMHDLAAINALIRPGAREGGITEEYAKRKHGQIPESEWYWHPSVEEILKDTYGLMLYQEDVMQIVQTLGGFTEAEADDMRKAMGKKYREGMRAVIHFLDDLGYEKKWMDGASGVVGEQLASEIWKGKILPNGSYAFNRSHSYSYALITYHDMLFKTIAPADFYAWLLTFTSTKDLSSKLAASLREGRGLISVKAPDINHSGLGFKVLDRQTILYGIESVKGIGPAGSKAIFENRPYTSYEDFAKRVAPKHVKQPAREALIGVGAFDAFGLRDHMTDQEKASNELGFIGIKITGKSDIDQYADMIEEVIHTEEEFLAAPHKAQLCVGGEITGIKHTTTKKAGEAMGFVNLAFGQDEYRVTVFPQVWAQFCDVFVEGAIGFFEGEVDISEQFGHGFIAKDFVTLEQLLALEGKRASESTI